jgi:hypothetical protein
MKKMFSLLITCALFSNYSFGQETLQSVTNAGNTTTNTIISVNNAAFKAIGTVGSPSYYHVDQRANTGGKLWRFGHTGAAAGFGSFDIYNETDNIASLSVSSSGNVGIGTTSPTNKLEVNGDGFVNGYLTSSRSDNEGGGLWINNPSKTGTNANRWAIYNMTGGYGNGLNFWKYGDGGNTGPQLQLMDNGTSTFTGTLAVNGNQVWHAGNLQPVRKAFYLSSDLNTYTEPGVYEYDGSGLGVTNSPTGSPNYRVLSLGNSNRWTQLAFQYGSDHVFFRRNDESFGSWRELWHSGNLNPANYFLVTGGAITGDVSIGNSSAQNDLSVNGSIKTRKVKVTQTDWADYVFDSSYQLAPLHQVEKYIQQNKHLPDVPSAAEVKKDGVDLGDTQAVLLKKIEELTLYIIEQNKELKSLAREVKALKENKK